MIVVVVLLSDATVVGVALRLIADAVGTGVTGVTGVVLLLLLPPPPPPQAPSNSNSAVARKDENARDEMFFNFVLRY